MKIDVIAKLIQKKYKFLSKPARNEVIQILSRISKTTTEKDLDILIDTFISKKTRYLTDSVDMSDTISLLDQIQDVLDEK